MISTILKGKYFIVMTMSLAFLFTACSDTNSQTKEKSSASSASSATDTSQSDETKFKEAPDFTLTKMNGESFTLSEHEGKVIVLNVWATWCPPCRKEIPDFIEI